MDALIAREHIRMGSLITLESALRITDNRPLPQSMVDAYKEDQVRRHPPSFWYGKNGWLILIPTVAAGFIGYMIGQALGLSGDLLSAAVVFPPIGALCVVGWMMGVVQVRGPAVWKCTPTAEYDMGTVPLEVHIQIINISSLYPAAGFNIHYLEQDKVILDPLLEVYDPEAGEDTERYFIKVWDEDGAVCF